MFSQGESLLMMSGFFSAINSFSDQFENMGNISELKLSNNNVKLSFLRDNTLPNLVYLATFDDASNGVNVQRALRKISRTFLQKYNINQILSWRGRKDSFKAFEEVISDYVEDEKSESETEFKEKVVDLFKNVEEKLNENLNPRKNSEKIEVPHYYNIVPSSRTSKKVNPRYYLTGKPAHRILLEIDGEKNINQIASKLSMPQEQVYNICKNFVKLGFISLDDF